MKINFLLVMGVLAAGLGLQAHGTTINAVNNDAYGANIGWLNFQGDVANGASIGLYYSTGFVWSANCGWINLGSGAPVNGHTYANDSAGDWGVNLVLPGGYLRGYAYGANIGWINFETNGNARVDLATGAISGYAYGANVGWISLSNAQGFVQTDSLNWGPDTDNDGIPDAYEQARAGDLVTLGVGGDYDVDGSLDVEEFMADTDPLDDESILAIASLQRLNVTNALTWPVESTRTYRLEKTDSISNNVAWTDSGLGVLAPGEQAVLTGVVVNASATSQFYRAKAVVPLAP